ncbi:MAG TPA: Asp-tRNA(Asn)/Glu-tRNA(Gln) amidotransferase subunit GatC [Candidatus Dormibacteraeota bacterium]
MTLSRDDVRHVAMLARLGLEPGEEDFYVQQLSAILAHIDRLREVDTDAIPPTAQAVPLALRMRDDEPRPGLSQDEAVANAPEARDGLFVVRAIQEAEP